jgi:hypothetical protein
MHLQLIRHLHVRRDCDHAAPLRRAIASVDPTDPSHFTNVLVRNDTTSDVQFIQCDTSCGTLHERRTIPADGSTVVNVSNEGIKVGYVVARSDGRKLGCVYMRYERIKHEPTVLVSSMTRCE